MAIIRTTNNETPSGGFPPNDGEPGKERTSPTKSVVSQRKKASAARSITPRQQLPGVQVQSNSSRSFFADTMTELNRVVWPTKEEVTSGSIVTILLLFFFGIYIGLLDFAAQGLFNMLGLYK
jgi:preprotein translocase subunit SecE